MPRVIITDKEIGQIQPIRQVYDAEVVLKIEGARIVSRYPKSNQLAIDFKLLKNKAGCLRTNELRTTTIDLNGFGPTEEGT